MLVLFLPAATAFTAGGADATTNPGAMRYIDWRSGKCLRCDGADAAAMGLVNDPVGELGLPPSAPRLRDYNKNWSVCRRPKRGLNYDLQGNNQFEPVPD